MKTALFISSNSHSLLHFRRALIERLKERHFSIIVCCPHDGGSALLHKEFKKLGIKTVHLAINNTKKNLFHDLYLFFNLIKLIKNNHIDYMFLYHIKPILYGSLAGYIVGVRNIYSTITGLGYAFTEQHSFSLTQWIVKRILVLSLFLNKKVFFQNKDDLELVCKNNSLKRSAVLINGSGVDVDLFKFTPVPPKLSFLFVGRLLKHKGIYEYVEACRILKKKYPSISFKIAGGFHPNPSTITKKDLDSWITEGVIEYLGNVSNMLPVFQKASVCVLPSYREGCPRSLLEAMSVGRAIITTDAPGCRETVREGENGYLVPIKNVARLEKAMEKFVEAPSLVKEMGLKSRKLAEKKFNVHNVNKKILEDFDNVVEA